MYYQDRRFSTRADGLAYIEGSLGTPSDYNVPDIFDAVMDMDGTDYVAKATPEEFWSAAEANLITFFTAEFMDGTEPEMDENGPTGRTLHTLIITDPEGTGVDSIYYATEAPEDQPDTKDVDTQIREQGWGIYETRSDGSYLVARA